MELRPETLASHGEEALAIGKDAAERGEHGDWEANLGGSPSGGTSRRPYMEAGDTPSKKMLAARLCHRYAVFVRFPVVQGSLLRWRQNFFCTPRRPSHDTCHTLAFLGSTCNIWDICCILGY